MVYYSWNGTLGCVAPRSKNKKQIEVMKTIKLLKTIVAAALLCGSAVLLPAQNANPTCPLGQTPGCGRSLNAEQRAALQAEMQKLVAELRVKKANGTITAEEQAWLQRMEQRGGACVGGQGCGQGKGQGPKDGTGNQWRRGQGQGRGCGQGCRQTSMLETENLSNLLVAQCDGKGQGQGPKDGTGQQKGKGKGKGKGTGTCPV